ncbi:MAG: hypothetical protein PVH61_29945 [Candidatus Aminicenantes bacterium]|jgi:hypothetical protein
MSKSKNIKKYFRELAEQSAQEADKLLEEELSLLKELTDADLETLAPEITGTKTYEQLLKIVQEANHHNEALAVLKDRVSALGSEAVSLVKKIVKL